LTSSMLRIRKPLLSSRAFSAASYSFEKSAICISHRFEGLNIVDVPDSQENGEQKKRSKDQREPIDGASSSSDRSPSEPASPSTQLALNEYLAER